MRRLALLVLLAAALLVLPRMLGTDLPEQVSDLLGTSEPDRARAVVVRVTDGDTLRVRMPNGREEAVRILGIDTPEVYPESECGGPEATAAMARLAPVGSRIVLESDPTQDDRDRYDRMLRYVTRSGDDVGLGQIASGHARVFVFGDNPFERSRSYERAEGRAEADGRGSWATCWR